MRVEGRGKTNREQGKVWELSSLGESRGTSRGLKAKGAKGEGEWPPSKTNKVRKRSPHGGD